MRRVLAVLSTVIIGLVGTVAAQPTASAVSPPESGYAVLDVNMGRIIMDGKRIEVQFVIICPAGKMVSAQSVINPWYTTNGVLQTESTVSVGTAPVTCTGKKQRVDAQLRAGGLGNETTRFVPRPGQQEVDAVLQSYPENEIVFSGGPFVLSKIK
jgi:hypothetical protein